jgi:NAD(P)H dehydrogenase (quinone)
MKNILIINGHPSPNSYCNALTEAYKNGASSKGNHVMVLNLFELKFDLNLANGYSKRTDLEPDLILAQEKITWAQHIVIVHPVWWGSTPALLKGFFDRIFLPGFSFKYRQEGVLWDKLLKGRTGHIIFTSDTPIWIYNYFFLSPSVNQVKKRTLEFCGISPVKVTGIGPIRQSKQEFREKWLERVKQLGEKAS